MSGLIIKPRSRIFHGHEWVFASEVQKTLGKPENGDLISLKDFRDRPLGTAIYNSNSLVVARRISRRKQQLDQEFFERRIQQAIDLRERTSGIDLKLCRLVFSDADGLPGVIVDRYADNIAIQLHTPAMHQRKDIIVAALLKLLSPNTIVLRNDSSLLNDEGLGIEIQLLHGENLEPFVIDTGSAFFEVDLLSQQAPPPCYSLMESYTAIAELSKGKKVLDVYCGQGGFSLNCAKAGALSVTAVDASEDAVKACQRNATLNGVDIKVIHHNPFDFLKHHEDNYDLIIINPPFVIKNKKTLNEAMRNYKDLHLRALNLLNQDGVLATFCNSHHVSRELLVHNTTQSSVDAKRTLRMIQQHSQRADHPILPAIPETDNLKGFTLELAPSR